MQKEMRTMTFICGTIALVIVLLVGTLPAHAASIELISPHDGEKVSIVNKKAESWWTNYKRYSAAKNKKAKSLAKPKSVKLKWHGKKGYTYHVYVSLSPTMDDCKEYTTKKSTQKVKRLLRGQTYYWKVVGTKGKKRIKSKTWSFRTKNTARIVRVYGVANVRDLGGYKAAHGKKVKQGMVYRCGKLDKITTEGINILRDELQAKTDLDLRRVGEGLAGEGSPALDNYIHAWGASYSAILENDECRARFIEGFRVFANPDNYPIVVHCVYGRDRTGTLSFMLNAFLGVSKKNLYRDYELTYLTKCSCKTAKKRTKKFVKLYNKMASYKDSSKSLSYNVEAYLLDSGMTPEELESIRTILLE